MSYNYKCTTMKCRRSRTLKRPIEEYVHRPKCKHCRGNLKPNPWIKRQTQRFTCKCDAYNYPHKSTTSIWCKSHPTGPSVIDYGNRCGWEGISDWEIYCCEKKYK